MTNSINPLIDIVLQGPMHEYTPAIALEYSKLSFVNSVIVSCWDTDIEYKETPENIMVVRSKDVFYPGIGNRNRQIKSSRSGLNYVVTEYVAKMRTDQFVSIDSMHKLYNYYFDNNSIELEYTNKEKPYNKIGVHGICRDFAFHPIDHMYWGNTQDIIKFFDIEYDSTKISDDISVNQFNYYVRSETYITMPYICNFNSDIKNMIDNPKDYLYDNSIKKQETLDISSNIMDKIFTVFPKINLSWPKHGMHQYHYEVMESERGGHAYWAK